MEFGTQLAAFDQQVIDTMAWIDVVSASVSGM
jgi:hypothetical protein